jgi:2-dehydropantoate 2-reductase
MRYIVIGAGSVGGTIGGRLAEAGHDVVLVARGAHLEALRSDGLTLLTPRAQVRPRLLAVGGPGELTLTPDDALVLAVKSQDSTPLLEEWSAQDVAGGGTAGDLLPLVCAQNGVTNERMALRRFARVYGMCVWLPAALADPGQVVAQGDPFSGVLEVGRYPQGVDTTTATLVADLRSSSFLAYEQEQVMPWKYGKLLANLSNAAHAATGTQPSPAGTQLQRLVLEEALACYEAAGIHHLDLDAEQAKRGDKVQVLVVDGHLRTGGSSWQSLNRGLGSIEADYLNGEIVLLGRLHGVPTPANALLQQVANRLARDRKAPGSIQAEDLLARIQ